ncbi:MAG: nucleoside-diphosphate sugar epimerase/dehydratase, partial [Terriglobia bacterium]
LYVRAIALSSILCMLTLLFTYRFGGFSRAAMVVDAVLLLFMMTASRMSFQILQTALRKGEPNERVGQSALIYGAGEMGTILVKELQTDSRFGYVPIGFIDDDPNKRDKTIHGYRILSDSEALGALLEQHSIAAVIVACRELPEEKLERVRRVCQHMQVPIKRMTINLE